MSQVAGGATVAALAVIAGFHLVWSRSSWPFRSRPEFARNLVGRPDGELPDGFPLLSVAVGILLLAAAYLVAGDAEIVSSPLPEGLMTVATWGVGIALAGRGAGGLVQSGFGIGVAPDRYRQLDLRIYSPLCVVLVALILVQLLA